MKLCKCTVYYLVDDNGVTGEDEVADTMTEELSDWDGVRGLCHSEVESVGAEYERLYDDAIDKSDLWNPNECERRF